MTDANATLRSRLAEGVLAFPTTPFTADLTLDQEVLAAHIDDVAAAEPVALVPAGGAGEIFSLSPAEHATIVTATVRHARGIPVMAGVGGSVVVAAEMARAAERAGAMAVLLLPPYLITPDQAGLGAYVQHIAHAVSIGVVVYSRDNGIFAPATVSRLAETCPNLIGLKDGTGDFEALGSMLRELGGRLVFINGVPTAEILARQCFAIGIRAYSSAVFSFLPAVALAFYRAVRDDDQPMAQRLINEFYLPLVELRNRRRGYAVSIIKAGLRVVGKPAGPVRPPLVDLDPSEQEELGHLIERASNIVSSDTA